MNNNLNMILLLFSIIIIILTVISYLEFKKIKIEIDKHNEILNMYKEKIELLLNLNKQFSNMYKENANTSYNYNNVNEVNVQNARMLYTNQALGSTSLNGRQKNKIVEAISKASTVEEAKVIFETLQSAVGSTTTKRSSAPNSLSEAVVRRSSTRVSHSNQDQGPKDDPNLARMKALAGLN